MTASAVARPVYWLPGKRSLRLTAVQRNRSRKETFNFELAIARDRQDLQG